MLIDLHSSWHSVNQVPAYLQNNNLVSAVASSFRRTGRARKGIASSRSSTPVTRALEIRKRPERVASGNGSPSISHYSASTSRSAAAEAAAAVDLELFLELLPPYMRRELCKHEEIGELIEVVLDLGRKPIARFPSGDCVISEQPVEPDDLNHAISKVI